ncbi:MAG: Gfo/Idh/MocA family protein [Promethearchaeota archaeon]
MLKVGFIGTGTIFDLNVLGYLENPDVEIISLCNRTVDKAKQKKKKFNLGENVRIYSDYSEMLKKEDLDIVEILLPHHLHAEVTIKAAQSGVRAISVQKPMALSLEEAENMIEVCEESGTILSIYENFLFAPHIQKAKELISNDYIGDPSFFRIKTIIGVKGGWALNENAVLWRKDPRIIGGAEKGSPILFDNGWHAFSLAWWMFGEEIEKVFAWTGYRDGYDAPAHVMFKYKESNQHLVPQYGIMEFTFMDEMEIPAKYYPADEFIEIIASRGIMKINQCTSIGNKMTESSAFDPLVLIRDGVVESFKSFQNDWKYSFINATRNFIGAVKNNKKPFLSGKEAKYVLKFNLAAIKSSKMKKEIYLDEL